MEDLPEDLRSFLQKHPCFQLTDSKKHFTAGKKYKKLSSQAEFDYSQYEPHIVSSTKQPNHLFCKLTLRHINRVPQHVLRHVSGKRYKKALDQYEECVRQGVEYVPVQLKQKKRPKENNEAAGSERRASRKDDSGVWAPNSSDSDNSDSEDSMSDLYPPSLFTVKKADDEQNMSDAEEDDFQTDDDDDDDDEVSEMEVENQMQKRKKVSVTQSCLL
ncbi:Surfeit locus protein 2 [Labeo rohita]|uniref:Surfeit locus protein 2 n=1 Tax=Labeo rohita TaxID=84645 RepID=A0ABQ8MQK5_LABRO|nr:Surfeit locus protein 2 [Labeo rohita]